METFSLFAHPVAVFKLPSLESEIKEQFKIEEQNKTLNEYNSGSQNDFILENKNCNPLKLRILECLKTFNENILSSKLDMKITQSWLNFTDKGEKHHSHYHPNSVISGVYYYDVDEQDSIVFQNPFKPQFDFNPEIYNIFNSTEWKFGTEQDTLFLFMSYLEHKVETKLNNGIRKTLAFNTFFNGEIGLKSNKTYLRNEIK